MGNLPSSLLFRPPPLPLYSAIDNHITVLLPESPTAPARLLRHPLTWLVTARGDRIPAVWIRVPGAAVTLLYAHSNGEDLGVAVRTAVVLAEETGCSCLAFDYTGYGLSHPVGGGGSGAGGGGGSSPRLWTMVKTSAWGGGTAARRRRVAARPPMCRGQPTRPPSRSRQRRRRPRRRRGRHHLPASFLSRGCRPTSRRAPVVGEAAAVAADDVVAVPGGVAAEAAAAAAAAEAVALGG
ncbi:hypothetical protein I4F81_001603 [Pyropia yezoensis]|uniref:Uncharacterized protein n=1 Tax=Pyropia yezoensis TaxID=2788 RepID=A0ACC3BM32_PYRYE|nr:hypothetical protein I4F81_001603 [Neopyropia yezoensis]